MAAFTHAVPEEAFERGKAHAVVTGDGDLAWAKVVNDCLAGKPERVYAGGRWRAVILARPLDLMDPQKYMWPRYKPFAAVQALLVLQRLAHRRTEARQRNHQRVVDEIIELRRIVSLHRPGR